MQLSFTEENYLKAVLLLTVEIEAKSETGTNQLAAYMGVKPATATDMLKRLTEKKLLNYRKYGKVTLTSTGKKAAIEILRKHRLWQTFLYEKLDFTWDEVNEVAHQLEHIHSEKLTDKLAKFLGNPQFDPHGGAIPDAKGQFNMPYKKTLLEVQPGHSCTMVAVKDNSATFLQYVMKVGLGLHNKIQVLEKSNYDNLIHIEVNGHKSSVSEKFAENIFVICNNCAVGKACVKLKCDITNL
jgi:DtxR family Mn-dependent transcriptional regulator